MVSAHNVQAHIRNVTPFTVAILLSEGMTAGDAIGPYEVLRFIPGATIQFVAEAPGPKRMDSGFLTLVADYSLEEAPHPDIIVVAPPPPGSASYTNDRLLSWLRNAHETAQWTTSVCAGSLLLGEAGLLHGKRATSNLWVLDELARFGATPCPDQRYVQDGKIITAAGVWAGIDMALYLASQIAGDEVAQAIQLLMEYDPQPPFDTGSPAKAPPAVANLAQTLVQEFIAKTIERNTQAS
ncbi:MAG: DJ-1/PfpI family protein [Chloroflexales bacterium]|nr:DJ-1/PfpI family protein [Chloroflexales bacterium]